MSKTNIKSIIKKIMEQIDYGDYPERMDPGTERRISDPTRNVYGTSPAMPRGTQDIQKIASERFKEVVDKLRAAIDQPTLTSNTARTIIMNEFMSSTIAAKSIERRFKDQLEKLAIKAALDVTETEEGKYNIKAILTDAPGMIGSEKFQLRPKTRQPRQPEPPIPPQGEEELFQEPGSEDERIEVGLDREEFFQLEVHKRNIINGIIQGAAKKGHYIFQKPSIKQELDNINPDLYDYYLKVMAINDYFYFTMQSLIDTMSSTGTGIEGREDISSVKAKPPEQNDDEGEEGEEGPEGAEEVPQEDIGKFDIVAKGLLFPILCHEVIKGIEETLGKFGYAENDETAQEVIGQTDILSHEAMHLRIGPGLVQRIRQHLPDEMFSEENFGIKPFFFMILYKIPARPFLSLIADVVSDDERDNNNARNKFKEIFQQALATKQRYERKRQGTQEPTAPPEHVTRSEPTVAPSAEDVDNATLAGMGLNALNFELNKAIDDQNWELAQKIQRMIDRKQR